MRSISGAVPQIEAATNVGVVILKRTTVLMGWLSLRGSTALAKGKRKALLVPNMIVTQMRTIGWHRVESSHLEFKHQVNDG